MTRLLCCLALALVALALAGCEKEVAQTDENLHGAWRAPFGDVVATITFDPNGYFAVDQDTEGTAGSQLFQVGAWGKNPLYGQWRLGEGEVTFLVDGATAGGLEIAAMYEDRILFKAGDGSPMYFKRVPAQAVPKPADDEPADAEDDTGEGMEEEAGEGGADAGGADGMDDEA